MVDYYRVKRSVVKGLIGLAGLIGSTVAVIGQSGVFVNQAGYRPGDLKVFLTDGEPGGFRVLAEADGTVVYEGKVVPSGKGRDEATGLVLSMGDFSGLGTEGKYWIELADGVRSVAFPIGEDVYLKVAEKALRSFYYQRCGVGLESSLVGEFGRKACHVDDAYSHESLGYARKLNSAGGWHDAGDFGKYVHATAVSVGLMLQMYAQYPASFGSDDMGIPESGNGIPDFLDEMRVALDWMLAMQVRELGSELEGGVHTMVNTKDYIWSVPEEDQAARWVYGVSSVATGDFAAAMALASRVFREFEATADLASNYLEGARMAWAFLERHPGLFPEGGYVRPSDTKTGGYFDQPDINDRDDRLWAAVELAISTGENGYLRQLEALDCAYLNRVFFEAEGFEGSLEWGDVSAFAIVQAVMHPVPGISECQRARLKRLFLERCDTLVERGNADGFGVVLDRYYWGSTGGTLGLAQFLLLGAKLVDSPEGYLQTAFNQLHYVLGSNALNQSFVTGVGARSPQFLHHAALANDGIERPFPGLLAGGPNPLLAGDQTLPLYFDDRSPPALCLLPAGMNW